MIERKNILISSAGRRVSLVKQFKSVLESTGQNHARVITSDMAPDMSAACQLSDGSFKVGSFNSDDYLLQLLEKCKEYNIGLIIPTIDTGLKLFAANKEHFASNGIEVVISDFDIVTKCRDKRLTHELFQNLNIEVPTQYDNSNLQFPCFAKPVSGSSSINLHYLPDERHLSKHIKEDSSLIFMEYLSSHDYDEYTCDLYFSKEGQLISIVPRLRIKTRGGEISKGKTVKNFIVDYVKERFRSINKFKGPVTLQLFAHKETSKIFGIEINPRFGGGFPMSFLAGANYPKFIIDEYVFGKEIAPFDSWKADLVFLRYDNELPLN